MARWEFRIKFLMIFYTLRISAQNLVPPSLDFGLPRRPSTTCTFNPCTIPNFCGTGRTCEIDDSCISRCSCLDDTTHPDCAASKKDVGAVKQNGLTGNKTQTSNGLNTLFESKVQSKFDDDPITSNTSVTTQCNFDPCKTMSWLCDGGRTCVTRDCILHCECTPGSTHRTCFSDMLPEINDTEDCGGFAGMRCVHGECIRIEDAWSCQCDEDWRGALCDQHVSTGCRRACDYGYECSWYMNTLQICKPKQTTITIHNSTKENSTSLSSTSNPCLEGYTLHPISHRNCSSGLLCQYGVCEDEKNGSSVCLCDQGALGPTCNVTCCRDCGVGGECIIGSDDGADIYEVCRCFPHYSGEDCKLSEQTVTSIPWYIWLIITCSITLVLLLILLVVIPYILWKRRVIPIMKIVHHFQGFEDDDGRDVDVFILCQSEIQNNFVIQVLVPKLEDEFGLKTFIHYQNSTPQNSINNEVLQTIQTSRRIILVLSTAQYRMSTGSTDQNEPSKTLKDLLPYKNRIIPIVLSGVSGSTSGSRPTSWKKIANPLVWPGSSCEEKLIRFWNQLELSLPKKRNRFKHHRIEHTHHQNGIIPKHQYMGTKKSHQQNGHSVAHIHTEYETDHYHKINGISRL